MDMEDTMTMERNESPTNAMEVDVVENTTTVEPHVVAVVVPKKRALEATSDATSTALPVVCCTCSSAQIKYRCPRCERISCSLACCLAHKKEYDCNGKRDRTKYIPTKQFTDSDLTSDFFFLEEVTRSTGTAARSRSQLGVNVKQFGQNKAHANKKRRVITPVGTSVGTGPGGAVNPHVPADWLTRFPVAFQLVVQHAAKRGVAVTLLAPGMSKRVRNTSFMNTKASKLYWRIEWSFPSAEVPVSHFEERADDALTPNELLEKYLEKRPENTSIRSKLKKYATPKWRDEIVLLLRKEFTPTSQIQYYRLDGHASIESNLKRKAVVEFPVILVVLRADVAQFHIVNDVIELVEANEPVAGEMKQKQEDEDDVVVAMAEQASEEHEQEMELDHNL